jgi:DNA invertase Pin-like site-specific DNA recombinase
VANNIVDAAAYYRMSDDRQENSLQRQRSLVEPYAQKHGYRIIAEYTDPGIAGDEIAKRKEFQRMLRDAQAGRFKVILCDDKDRFGRFDSIDGGEVIAPLRRKGVRLETVAQGRTDWNSFAGRITDAVLQEAKSMELDAISRRVLSGQLLRARLGRSTGGRTLYGYRWEPDPERGKRMVPDGLKAEVVRLVFRMYDEGHSLHAVSEELYRRGQPSPRGKPRWTPVVIQRILSNQRYAGDWTWGVHPQGKRHCCRKGAVEQTERGEKRPRRSEPGCWIVLPDDHEPLVDRERFERVQAQLAGNRARTTPHPRGGNFVLSKLLVCGHCGCSLIGVTERGVRYYVCRGYFTYGKTFCSRNRVAEAAMVKVLIRKLRQAFLDPVQLQRLRKAAADLEAERRDDRTREHLARQIETLTRQVEEGNERLLLLPPDRIPGVVAKLREWEVQRDKLREQLRQAEAESPVEDLEAVIDRAEAELWRLEDALQAEDAPLLRELFREWIDHVRLFWDRRQVGKVVRTAFREGEVATRATSEPSNLFPSAAQ